MIKQQRHIDLHLPGGWNQCTTRELQIIAAAINMETARADRYRPFDMLAVKTTVFLAINDLTIIAPAAPSVPSGFPAGTTPAGTTPAATTPVPAASTAGTTTPPAATPPPAADACYTVRFRQPTLWQRLRARIGRHYYDFDLHPDTEAFELPVGYVHAMINQHLAWLDDERAEPLVTFPYPQLKLRRSLLSPVAVFAGPPALMDGYTWTEYRLLQDWMQMYVMQHNHLLALTTSRNATTDDFIRTHAAVDKARTQFLAILFKAGDDRAHLFRDFDPVKWQVILFWWSGLMKILAKKFHHVFKVQPVKRGEKRQTPWDFYNRVTATLQRDGHLSEEELNAETYSVTLQKLEQLAEEAEELKKKK